MQIPLRVLDTAAVLPQGPKSDEYLSIAILSVKFKLRHAEPLKRAECQVLSPAEQPVQDIGSEQQEVNVEEGALKDDPKCKQPRILYLIQND